MSDENKEQYKTDCINSPERQQDYKTLILRVETISPEAAEYLRTDANELTSFSIGGDLKSVFVWSESPQGNHFWWTIADQLEQL
jgi:hypothetical protein